MSKRQDIERLPLIAGGNPFDVSTSTGTRCVYNGNCSMQCPYFMPSEKDNDLCVLCEHDVSAHRGAPLPGSNASPPRQARQVNTSQPGALQLSSLSRGPASPDPASSDGYDDNTPFRNVLESGPTQVPLPLQAVPLSYGPPMQPVALPAAEHGQPGQQQQNNNNDPLLEDLEPLLARLRRNFTTLQAIAIVVMIASPALLLAFYFGQGEDVQVKLTLMTLLIFAIIPLIVGGGMHRQSSNMRRSLDPTDPANHGQLNPVRFHAAFLKARRIGWMGMCVMLALQVWPILYAGWAVTICLIGSTLLSIVWNLHLGCGVKANMQMIVRILPPAVLPQAEHAAMAAGGRAILV